MAARAYRQKKRAESRERTRQRIVDAAIELHTTVGPAHTTVTAVAERARVERLTFYRHFPTEHDLLAACSRHYIERYPPPDPGAWRRIRSPRARLEKALKELFAYYARTEGRWTVIRRDVQYRPDLREFAAQYVVIWRRMVETLIPGRPEGTARRRLLEAVLAHVLDFATWQSLVRQQGLKEAAAIRLLGAMVDEAERGGR